MVSKSNVVEIIAILWLIAGFIVGGWFKWVGIALFAENVIESMFYSYKEHKTAPITKKEGLE